MRIVIISLFLSLSIFAVDKANFIIIFTDDQGYADLSCFGSEDILTPNIDKMAEEGRKFTSFYVASSICTPSRTALLTGNYPKRVSMEKGVIFPQNTHGLNPEEVTIAEYFKSAGYATAAIGKWHLGHLDEFLPTNQGFDYYYGIPYSNDMNHPDNKNKPWGKWDPSWNDPEMKKYKWNTPLLEGKGIIELPVDQRTITRRYTDKAIEFISENKDKPFFLYLPHSMPHLPLFVPDELYEANSKNPYKIVIEHIDDQVGRVVQKVKDLGLDKKTYIIFTSDNGPWLQFKHHAGTATPLRSGKGSIYEGGFRVPCVMWAPGNIPAGTDSNAMISTMDLLPSFASIVGAELKTNGSIDGVDQSALIHANGSSNRRELLYYTGRGELAGLRQDNWKILQHKGGNIELFDLSKDLSEKVNLAKENQPKVKALLSRMKELDDELSANQRPRGEGKERQLFH